jgi:rubrerythrin
MDLNSLQLFLEAHEIPKTQKKPKTFLSISKQSHYENVLSNIYAFFFDTSEEHDMGDLFLKSLQELIFETDLGKTKNITFKHDFIIETEFQSESGGRIDVVLYNDEDSILIENKVYHILNNDLKDYWNSVNPGSPEENRIGIILSLKNYSQSEIKHPQFINITHSTFLDRVMKNSGEYLLKAKDRYIVFLKDFYQNTLNLSNYMEKEKIEFYYKYQTELNNAAKLKFAVRDFIKDEIKHACDSIDRKLQFYSPKSGSNNEKKLRYFVSPLCNKLMFTIFFDGLLEKNRVLKIVVELNGEAIQKVKDFGKENFNQNELEIISDDFYSETRNWVHFAVQQYSVGEEDIKNLNSFIKDKIENDSLLSIYKKLETFLLKEIKDIINDIDFM